MSETRILVRNQILLFIYDFKLDRVIAEKFFYFQKPDPTKFKKIDNLYITNEGEHIQLLRTTKKGEEGVEIPEKQNFIHFNDLIPNLSSYIRSGIFNCFKLKNGNYLYVGQKHFEEDVRVNGTDAQKNLVSIEIDRETLEVRNFNVALPAELDRYASVDSFHMVGEDLLVFKTELRRPQNDQNGGRRYPTLVLATTDFTILDHCSQAKLSNIHDSIIAASSNRIVSAAFGTETRVYLHEVDTERKNLVLLKSIVLDGVKILRDSVVQRSSHFSLFVKNSQQAGPGDNQQRILLKFDMELNLVSHLRTQGVRSFSSMYALSCSKVACSGSPSPRSKCLYVIDMKKREIQFAHKYRSDYATTNYLVDGEQGQERELCLDLDGEKIVKIVLN